MDSSRPQAAGKTSSLGLDDELGEEHPRRFLRLPSGQLLAYGGNNGNVSCLFEPPSPSTDHSRFVIVQQYDDGVRAMAVSEDGKRLAVGLEDGSTKIYMFDDYTTEATAGLDGGGGGSGGGDADDNTDEGSAFHPYVRKAMLKELKKYRKAMTGRNNTNNSDDPLADDDDNDDDFDDFDLSQSFQTGVDLVSFPGPKEELPIRDMAFLPTPTSKQHATKSASSSWDGENGTKFDDTYVLAVASESGITLASATSNDDRINSYVMTSTPASMFRDEVRDRHNNSGIRGMALHECDGGQVILATLSMDGFLCVWDMNVQRSKRGASTSSSGDSNYKFLIYREPTACIPRKDVGEHLDADAYDRSCRPIIYQSSLGNNDQFIVTPGKLFPVIRTINSQSNKIHCLEESIFKGSSTTDDNLVDGHLQSTVALLFCSARVLISSGRDSRIVVWKADRARSDDDNNDAQSHMTWKLCEQQQSKSPVTDFCIHNGIVFAACADGSFHKINVDKYLSTDESESTRTSKTSNSNDASKKSLLKRITKKAGASAVDGDDDDDDDDFGVDNAQTAETPAVASKSFIDDEADDSDDDEGHVTDDKHVTTASKGVRFADDDDFESFEIPDHDVERDHRIGYPMGKRMSNVQPQDPFSPSATPLSLLRRYLCWNNMGSITVHHGDDRNSTIDIQFTDVNSHRPITFKDNSNFIIGSLGEDGAIFASDLKSDEDDDEDDDDLEALDGLNMSERTKQAVRRDRKNREAKKDNSDPTGSTIYFHRFETFSSIAQKDWVVTLPDGELALGAATGEGWAAVMTSRRFLRFFSTGGTQGQVIWLEGEPVCMAGRGRYLGVFYHKSAPFAKNRTQQLGYTLWDAKDFHVISEGSVSCLSEGSILEWVGFDSDCGLFAMDSGGILSMLVPATNASFSSSRSWKWAPVLDTVGLRKSSDDHHWPVTVYDGKLICVPLKGGNTYPDAARRPVTTSLSLRMPLARSVVAKTSTMEEVSVRSNMALARQEALEDMDDKLLRKTVDKVTIKLFAALAEAGKQEAALDLTDRLYLSKSREVCIKYADRLGQTKLADKIKERFDKESDFIGRTTTTSSSSPMAGKRKNITPDQNVVKRGRV